jgi:selT/selW/selH-like putative selenoprotein
LAAEIEQRFPDAEVELIPSSGGRFEVVADATPVFQKSKVGRHPEPGEVAASLERLR